jgi:ferredoxin-type protein NapF
MQRRELFSSLSSKLKGERAKPKEIIVRPPYNQDNTLFDKVCIECEDTPCSKFCEEEIIIISNDKTPKLDFSISGCTFCEECAKACPHDVLSLTISNNIEEEVQDNTKQITPQILPPKIDIIVEIDMLKCLSWQKTMCFSCQEPCIDNAISFLGMFRPSIEADKCTSCGFCISRCPTDAIILKSSSLSTQ